MRIIFDPLPKIISTKDNAFFDKIIRYEARQKQNL